MESSAGGPTSSGGQTLVKKEPAGQASSSSHFSTLPDLSSASPSKWHQRSYTYHFFLENKVHLTFSFKKKWENTCILKVCTPFSLLVSKAVFLMWICDFIQRKLFTDGILGASHLLELSSRGWWGWGCFSTPIPCPAHPLASCSLSKEQSLGVSWPRQISTVKHRHLQLQLVSMVLHFPETMLSKLSRLHTSLLAEPLYHAWMCISLYNLALREKKKKKETW